MQVILFDALLYQSRFLFQDIYTQIIYITGGHLSGFYYILTEAMLHPDVQK